jgi:DNA polymerase-1
VRALDGRIRHLPQVYSKDVGIAQQALRQAVNSPVQGFASDLGLMSMARINDDADPNRLKPLGFIHDALVCLVREEDALWGARYVKRMMETNPLVEWFGPQCDFPIPIVADPDVGRTMAEMHELAEHPELLTNQKYQSYRDVLNFIGKPEGPAPRRVIRGITKPLRISVK